MTAHESAILEKLAQAMADLSEEVHIHVALTKEQFATFKALCDERHGLHPGRLAAIEGEVIEARGASKYARWLVPLVISLLSFTVGVLLATR